MPASAEVAACLKRMEKKMDRFSQKATYNTLTSKKDTILKNSSAVGGMPIAINPKPITRNPNTKSRIPTTIRAATNLAFSR